MIVSIDTIMRQFRSTKHELDKAEKLRVLGLSLGVAFRWIFY